MISWIYLEAFTSSSTREIHLTKFFLTLGGLLFLVDLAGAGIIRTVDHVWKQLAQCFLREYAIHQEEKHSLLFQESSESTTPENSTNSGTEDPAADDWTTRNVRLWVLFRHLLVDSV